jgi:ATPase family associated with various cellular activities (AAA)
MPESKSTKPTILPFQQPIFDRLCAVARASLYVDRKSIQGLKLRSCFLLIGPSGSGKTFLASALAAEMGVPFCALSVSDWIVLGGTNRGSSTTWPSILSFIHKSKSAGGAIIFIDELDKCRDESNWNSFLRSEIFSLCDARLPFGIQDPDADYDNKESLEEAAEFLRNRTMIIGGAAFQHIWDTRSAPTMGFNPTRAQHADPELPELTKVLPRELVNRFSSTMFVLPQLRRGDYRIMVETMTPKIPDLWKKRFYDLGMAGLDRAVAHQKGARYLEEVLLNAIVEERVFLTSIVPPPEANIDPKHETDVTQDDSIRIF